jgi:outer membrane protein OmpA-like peptidoglycan-associated protein
MIEGHTDSVGSDEMNMTLSRQRAQAVQSALTQRGVSATQISIEGRGESTPVASNDTAAGRQQNRRVEMIFTQEPKRVATGAALPNR